MIETLGRSECFLVYAGFCVGAFFFTRTFVPETRGKTLEEIENNLREAASSTGSSTADISSQNVSGSDNVAASGSEGSGSSLKSGLLGSDGP